MHLKNAFFFAFFVNFVVGTDLQTWQKNVQNLQFDCPVKDEQNLEENPLLKVVNCDENGAIYR